RASAANMTTELLFNPKRAARLVDFKARNPANLGFSEMVDQVIAATWKADPQTGYSGAIQRTVNFVTLYNLLTLAADDNASGQVKAVAYQKLKDLRQFLDNRQVNG